MVSILQVSTWGTEGVTNLLLSGAQIWAQNVGKQPVFHCHCSRDSSHPYRKSQSSQMSGSCYGKSGGACGHRLPEDRVDRLCASCQGAWKDPACYSLECTGKALYTKTLPMPVVPNIPPQWCDSWGRNLACFWTSEYKSPCSCLILLSSARAGRG
jgi:hypothetical protein